VEDTAYEERLLVPATWWLVGLGLVVSVWWVFVLATPAWMAWLAAVVALGLVVGLVGRYGAARLAVAGGQLRAGRAHISLSLCGRVETLDAEQTRRAGGSDADARAYLLLRPYIPTAVRVAIDDPNDPVPYWLLSTRRPERLAEAVEAGRRGHE
jgi:Protein of unknown function (DUF3093)